MNATDTTRGPPREGQVMPSQPVYNDFEQRRMGEMQAMKERRHRFIYGLDHPAVQGDAHRGAGPVHDAMYVVRYRPWYQRLAQSLLRGIGVRAVWVADRLLETGVKLLKIAMYFVILPTLAVIAMLSWKAAEQAANPADAAKAAGATAASTIGGFLSGFWSAVAGPDEAPAADEPE